MLEKEIIETELEHYGFRIKTDEKKEKTNLLRKQVFEDIIILINTKRTYMLGPEKTAAANFVANHFNDVYNCLKKRIKDI
ncbi:MAG: hypothetical protein ACTSR8_04490 [Promethearchaeota archaeon]